MIFDVIVIMLNLSSQSSMQLLWFELLKVYFRTLRLGNTGKKTDSTNLFKLLTNFAYSNNITFGNLG